MALDAYAAHLAELDNPLAELLNLVARGGAEEELERLRALCVAAPYEMLPTTAVLDAMSGLDGNRRAAVPAEGDRMACPFKLEWRGGLVDAATFEIYDQDSALGAVSANAYRSFVKLPACRLVRHLTIGNVACQNFEDSWLLGDPIGLLAQEGLPPYLEHLTFARLGPVSQAEDIGFIPIECLSPLHVELAHLLELDLARCVKLGRLSLPKLRALRLSSQVTVTNLKELAKADLPALEHLELFCDNSWGGCDLMRRWRAARALLRTKGLPRLTSLEIAYLDLDEDQREEFEAQADDEPESDPGPWTDMIADSPLLRQLERLTLSFSDDDRELPRLLERAADFHHLAALTISPGARAKTTLHHPTRDAIAAALTEA